MSDQAGVHQRGEVGVVDEVGHDRAGHRHEHRRQPLLEVAQRRRELGSAPAANHSCAAASACGEVNSCQTLVEHRLALAREAHGAEVHVLQRAGRRSAAQDETASTSIDSRVGKWCMSVLCATSASSATRRVVSAA